MSVSFFFILCSLICHFTAYLYALILVGKGWCTFLWLWYDSKVNLKKITYINGIWILMLLNLFTISSEYSEVLMPFLLCCCYWFGSKNFCLASLAIKCNSRKGVLVFPREKKKHQNIRKVKRIFNFSLQPCYERQYRVIIFIHPQESVLFLTAWTMIFVNEIKTKRCFCCHCGQKSGPWANLQTGIFWYGVVLAWYNITHHVHEHKTSFNFNLRFWKDICFKNNWQACPNY